MKKTLKVKGNLVFEKLPDVEEYNDNDINLKNRVGKFAIILNKGETLKNVKLRDELRLVFGSIIVINAYPMMQFDQIQYVCLCEQFDVISVGDNVPAYMPYFKTDNETGKISIHWEKEQ